MQSVSSKWKNICVLTPGEAPIIYPLDQHERHITQFKRQRRRNLEKMTGKHAHQLFDEYELYSLHSTYNDDQSMSEVSEIESTDSPSDFVEINDHEAMKAHEELRNSIKEQFTPCYQIDYSSISWLLNTDVVVSA